ncbi:hypothetical protein BH09ACT12_BH09ACT12_18420 [soil metagenome]
MGVMKDDELFDDSLAGRARRLRALPKRVSQLEEDMVEARELHVRVAELTDLVAELLVPLAKLDPEKAAEILERYQDELGS